MYISLPLAGEVLKSLGRGRSGRASLALRADRAVKLARQRVHAGRAQPLASVARRAALQSRSIFTYRNPLVFHPGHPLP